MQREKVTAYLSPAVLTALGRWMANEPTFSTKSGAIEQALEMFLRDRGYLDGYSRLADLEARVKELEKMVKGAID